MFATNTNTSSPSTPSNNINAGSINKPPRNDDKSSVMPPVTVEVSHDTSVVSNSQETARENVEQYNPVSDEAEEETSNHSDDNVNESSSLEDQFDPNEEIEFVRILRSSAIDKELNKIQNRLR
ncbi:uncharacterized protein EV154DRAFT_487878 [Mucor mucedo]|uniref:uncharacterized protein n=1 Tax=Mucor mucedo TaxID=29922 RepID=UPI00221FE72D|nr:uncharacterized protein EV154DRAFT_487878 [Mucor mucedo]KAI7870065.1 hypothetical protein EV154DRAFT_487878 [Mucor mucedo]